jgi:hypothetical protein
MQSAASGVSDSHDRTVDASPRLLLGRGNARVAAGSAARDDFHNWSGVAAETAAALPKIVELREWRNP